jgi:hypothetical protein
VCADAPDALCENSPVQLLFFNRAADIAQMLAETVSRIRLGPSNSSLFL